MDGPQDATTYIHLGFWMNHGKGNIRGLTFTTSPANSILLTNLMALFVTLAGGQFWTILRFSLHQIRTLSFDHALDVVYNQQQVILRNTVSATATAQSLAYLGWSSRQRNLSSPRRSSIVPLITLALFTAAFFIVAGVFSSTVTDAGPAVLSRSPFCGFYNQTYLDNVGFSGKPALTTSEEALVAEFNDKALRDLERSVQYAQECYGPQTTGSPNCGTFMKATLPVSTTSNGTCPFDSKVCLGNTDTVVFDTGLLSTHEDFGINAAPEDRLLYRRVTKCTVLNDTLYTTGWLNQSNYQPTQPTWRIANASYGQSTWFDTNVTYSYTNFEDFDTRFAAENSMSYTMGNDQAFGVSKDPSISSFIPIQELKQRDADVSLFYLSYSGSYFKPIDDPWFASHQPYTFQTPAGSTVTTFKRDRPISTLGCIDQYQVCTSSESCTPLLGFDQVQENIAAHLKLNSRQNVTLDLVLTAASDSNIFEVVDGMSEFTCPVRAIMKRQNGRHPITVDLPDDQWKIELSNWESIALANMQRMVVERQTGQIAAQPQYLDLPSTDSEKWLCQNLMIRSSNHQSFSVLALALIISFGTVVIVLSLTIESLYPRLLRTFGRGEIGYQIWRDHDMLGPQLWRARVEASSRSSSKNIIMRAQTFDKNGVYFPPPPPPPQHQPQPPPYVWDRKHDHKRASSQVLSVEDRNRILMARAYHSWI